MSTFLHCSTSWNVIVESFALPTKSDMGDLVEPVKLAKEDILDLRFPYKLWILINVSNRIVSWAEAGVSFYLDYVALNLYLSSAASIFKLKTGRKFLRQLTIHGFEKVPGLEEAPGSVILEFKHVDFVRGREDLVKQIHPENSPRKQKTKQKCQQDFGLSQSQRPLDPCLSKVRPLAAMERARLNLRVLLQMQNENFTLNKKLSECERKAPSSAVSMIELPADAFENPFDSISQFEENSEYAGYYGAASTEQIKQFFEEYLPVYAETNENSENSANQASEKEPQSKQLSYVAPGIPNDDLPTDVPSNPENFQVKYSVNLVTSASDDKEFASNVLEETVSQIASSVIGPDGRIATFAACEDANDTSGRDEDISMDEYLKFKESPVKEHIQEASETSNDVKPDLGGLVGESAIEGTCNADEANEEKTEDVDDEVGESNFKNFFNQYRESINLLYQ